MESNKKQIKFSNVEKAPKKIITVTNSTASKATTKSTSTAKQTNKPSNKPFNHIYSQPGVDFGKALSSLNGVIDNYKDL
jgi:hypothetical protein